MDLKCGSTFKNISVFLNLVWATPVPDVLMVPPGISIL